jgi:hypothetical protein
MVKKRQILKLGFDSDINLIGISCHLKSYRLSFAMDISLGLSFNRVTDFVIPGQGDESLHFPFLIYEDEELKNQFCLVGNHHPQGKLVPALRQVDYFLMAKNPLDHILLNSVLQKIRNIPQVLAAYEIDTSRTKDIDLLLCEMELHLMTVGKTA